MWPWDKTVVECEQSNKGYSFYTVHLYIQTHLKRIPLHRKCLLGRRFSHFSIQVHWSFFKEQFCEIPPKLTLKGHFIFLYRGKLVHFKGAVSWDAPKDDFRGVFLFCIQLYWSIFKGLTCFEIPIKLTFSTC